MQQVQLKRAMSFSAAWCMAGRVGAPTVPLLLALRAADTTLEEAVTYLIYW